MRIKLFLFISIWLLVIYFTGIAIERANERQAIAIVGGVAYLALLLALLALFKPWRKL